MRGRLPNVSQNYDFLSATIVKHLLSETQVSKTNHKTTLLKAKLFKTRRKIEVWKHGIRTAPSIFRLILKACSQISRKTNAKSRLLNTTIVKYVLLNIWVQQTRRKTTLWKDKL